MNKNEMHNYLLGSLIIPEPNKLELNLTMLLEKSEFNRLIAENISKQVKKEEKNEH